MDVASVDTIILKEETPVLMNTNFWDDSLLYLLDLRGIKSKEIYTTKKAELLHLNVAFKYVIFKISETERVVVMF